VNERREFVEPTTIKMGCHAEVKPKARIGVEVPIAMCMVYIDR
jgi:hypothetical protein